MGNPAFFSFPLPTLRARCLYVRRRRSLSLREAGAEIGVSYQTVKNFEDGGPRPTKSTAKRFDAWLQSQPQEILAAAPTELPRGWQT